MGCTSTVTGNKVARAYVLAVLLAFFVLAALFPAVAYAEEGAAEDGLVSDTGEPAAVKNGWYKEDGAKYYYVQDRPVTGWKTISGNKYYFIPASDGKMATGWKTIKSKRYYFKSSGVMVKGEVKIAGNKFKFSSGGVLQSALIKAEYVPRIRENACEAAAAAAALNTRYDTSYTDGDVLNKLIAYGLWNGMWCESAQIKNVLEKAYKATVIKSSASIETLCRKYIDKGIPVQLFVTTRKSGTELNKYNPETRHTMLLVGYDKKYYYFHDNMYGKNMRYTKSSVNAAYKARGKQALILL